MGEVKFDKWDLEQIGLSSWKKAKGIHYKRGMTNSALAERDYTIECNTGGQPIILFEGYHVWWCITHHQPLPWCERDIAVEKLKQTIRNALEQ